VQWAIQHPNQLSSWTKNYPEKFNQWKAEHAEQHLRLQPQLRRNTVCQIDGNVGIAVASVPTQVQPIASVTGQPIPSQLSDVYIQHTTLQIGLLGQ
jgi:hypothetical protein